MSLLISLFRRAASSSASRAAILTHEESRLFIRPYGFRGQEEFLSWSRSGARPAFIPSNPARSYRDCGWVSWPHWLGYQRDIKPPKEVAPRDSEIRANEAKAALIDEILQARPDIEFRELPKTLKASHLFRIRSASEEAPADEWIPVQLRFSSPCDDRGRGLRHVMKRTADVDTNVIILSACGGVLLGRAGDLPIQCPSSKFIAQDAALATTLENLGKWWQSGEKRSPMDIVRSLREGSQRGGVFGGEAISAMQRKYLDPLKLSLKRSGAMCSTPVNAIIDDQYKTIIRTASIAKSKLCVTVPNAPTDRRPMQAEVDFDFLITILPIESMEDGPALFLFPKSALLDAGVLATESNSGATTIYLYPPYKENKRSITAIRKAEQAPFFVDSVERFAEILNEYGDTTARLA